LIDITSLQNPRVKQIVKLRDDKKERQREGLMLVEGYDEISLAIEAGHGPRTLLTAPKLARRELRHIAAETITVSPAVFEKMSYRENPDGWLALFPPTWSVPRVVHSSQSRWWRRRTLKR
jgi:RNA methyltransferase, TrmH family